MLTGRTRVRRRRPSPTVLAAVIMREPDLAALPPRRAGAVRQLIARCLERRIRNMRLRDIGEARLGSGWIGSGFSPVRACKRDRRRCDPEHQPLDRCLATGLVLALVGSASSGAPPQRGRSHRLFATTCGRLTSRRSQSLDGLASPYRPTARCWRFASADGISRLHLRSRDDPAAHPYPALKGHPILSFSPDGKWMAFVGRRAAQENLP